MTLTGFHWEVPKMDATTARTLVDKGWTKITKKKFAAIVQALRPDFTIEYKSGHSPGMSSGRVRYTKGTDYTEVMIDTPTGKSFYWTSMPWSYSKEALEFIKENKGGN